MPADMTTAIPWRDAAFAPVWRQETSRSNAIVQVRDLGPMLWRASYVSAPLQKDVAEAFEARMTLLRGSLGTFYGHPAQRRRPIAYTGAAFGGVTVAGMTNNRAAIRLQGLVPGMSLRPGDYASITTAAGGRELIRLAEAVSADAQGVMTQNADCAPHLRPSVAVGQPVDLFDPLVELRLDAPVTVERISGPLYRVSFQATQVVW